MKIENVYSRCVCFIQVQVERNIGKLINIYIIVKQHDYKHINVIITYRYAFIEKLLYFFNFFFNVI